MSSSSSFQSLIPTPSSPSPPPPPSRQASHPVISPSPTPDSPDLPLTSSHRSSMILSQQSVQQQIQPQQASQQSPTAVQVVVRVRPLSVGTSASSSAPSTPSGSAQDLAQTNSGSSMLPGRARARAKEAVVVAPPQSGATTHHQVVVEGRKRFTFDSVFPGTVSQETLYGTVAPLVDRFLEGMNVTVMAYGQTGTGKTYTMGSSKEYIAAGGANPESEGIIPRAMFDIFSKLNDAEVATSSSYTLTCTFLEIYNEDLIDLFAPKDLPLQDRPSILIQDAPNGTIKWTGCRELPLDSADAALQRFLQGLENRQTSSTEMNLTSSRSHAIFTLNLRRRVRQSQAFSSSSRATPTNSEWKTVSCRFNFVDLAGSERLQRTGTVGARQREGIFINSGLLALGNVISALSQESGRPMHVPYRDSKLTRLLQDSLGGNSNTLMIACVSPAESDLGETLNTLKYANRANRVKNIAVVNQEQSDAEIEIQRLRALVADLREEVDSLRTGAASAPSKEAEILRQENVMLRRQMEAQREETLRLRAHRDYLANELAYLQSESLINLHSSADKSDAPLFDGFSDVESVTSAATGADSVAESESTYSIYSAGGSRIPVPSKKSKRDRVTPNPPAATPVVSSTHYASATVAGRASPTMSRLPAPAGTRSATPAAGLLNDGLSSASPSQPAPSYPSSADLERQLRRLRFDLREMTAAAQDYLKQVETLSAKCEKLENASEFLEVQLADLKVALKEAEDKATSSQEKVLEIEEKLNRAEVANSGAEEYIAGLEKQLELRKTLALQVQKLERELEQAKAEEADRVALLASLEARLAASESADYIKQIHDLEQEVIYWKKEAATQRDPPPKMPPIPPSIQTTPPTPEPPAQRVQLAEAQRRIAELESARSSLERKFAELEAEKDNTLTRRVAKFMMQPPASATDAPSSSAASGAGTVAPARPPQTLEEARLRAQAAESKLAMIFAQVAAEDEGIPASSVTSPTAAYSAVAGFMGRMLGSPTASEIGDDDGKRLEAMEETNRKLKEEVLALKARLKVVQEEAVASIRAASEAQLVDASYDAPLNQASKKRRSGDSSSRPLSPFANVEDLRRELSERRRMSLRSSSPLAVDPDNESGRPGSPDIKTIAPNLHITNRLLSETSKRLRSLSESAPNQTLPPRLPSVRLTPATPEVISKEAQTEFDLDSALNRLESALKEEHSRNANLTEELEQVRISRERRESQLSEGAAAAARKVSELERELSATRERLKVLLAEMANLQVAAAKSRLRSASSSSSDSGWGSGGMGASQGSVVDMEEHERVKEENASLRERLAGLSELRTRLIETAARHHTAEEMAEAKSKLERITNELAQLRSAYKAEVAELKAQLEALESERANLVRSLAERETVMRSAAVRVSALEMREVEIQREKEDALAKISALGEAKAAAEASIKELAARLEAVQEHHEKLMKRFEEEQAAVVAQLEATLAETTSALKAAQAAVVELTSRVSAGESAKLETEAALEAATAKVKLLESEAAKVKAALAESANVAAAAHASLAELQSAHADVSGQLEQATKARDVHVSRGVELETAVNCHKNRVSELEASIVELTAKLAAAEEQAALDKARIVELEATAAALVTKVDEATAEATQLKAKMDALETSLVSSVAEVAAARASLEDLTASYELLKDEKTALSAALEDSKQAAQCESETAARHAITTAELEARIKSLDDALATTQAELDAKERELQQLLAADTARAATLLELETKLSAANQRSEELVREVTESQATAGADKAALQSKVAALEAAIGEAEAKIEALEVAKEAVQSDLKRDLEAAQERVESLASELEVMRSATTTPRDLPLEDGVSEGLSNRSVDPSLDVDAIQNHLEELNAQAAEAAAIAQKVAEMEQIHIQERERLENRILELEEALRVAKDMTRAASPKTIGRADPTELNARVTGLQYRVKELESQLAAASQPQVARSMSRSSDSGDESVRSLWMKLAKSEDLRNKQTEEVKRLEDRLAEVFQQLATSREALNRMQELELKVMHAEGNNRTLTLDHSKAVQEAESFRAQMLVAQAGRRKMELELQKQSEAAAAEKKTISATLDDVRSRLAAVEKQLADAKAAHVEAEKKAAEAVIEAVGVERALKNVEIDKLKQEITTLSQQATELTAVLEAQEVSFAQKEQSLLAEVAQAKASSEAEISAVVARMDAEVLDLKQQVTVLTKQSSEVSASLSAKSKEAETLAQQLSTKTAETEALSQQLHAEIDRLKSYGDEHSQKHIALTEELSNHKAVLEKSQKDHATAVEGHTRAIEAHKETISSLEADLRAARTEVEKYKSKIFADASSSTDDAWDKLEARIVELEGLLAAAAAESTAAQDRFRQSLETVSSLEAQLAAAQAQALTLADERKAAAESAEATAARVAVAEARVAELLSEVAVCQAREAEATKALEIATQQANELRSLTAAKETEGAAAAESLLQATKERDTLREELAERVASLNAVEASLKQITSERDDLARAHDAKGEEHAAASQSFLAACQERDSLRWELTLLTRERDSAVVAREAIEARLAESEERVLALQAELTAASAAATTKESELAQLTSTIAVVVKERDTLHKQLEEQVSAMAAAERRGEESRALAASLEALLSQATQRAESSAVSASAAKAEVEQLSQQLATTRAAVAELEAKAVHDLASVPRSADSQGNGTDGEVSALSGKYQEAMATIAVLESRIAESAEASKNSVSLEKVQALRSELRSVTSDRDAARAQLAKLEKRQSFAASDRAVSEGKEEEEPSYKAPRSPASGGRSSIDVLRQNYELQQLKKELASREREVERLTASANTLRESMRESMTAIEEESDVASSTAVYSSPTYPAGKRRSIMGVNMERSHTTAISGSSTASSSTFQPRKFVMVSTRGEAVSGTLVAPIVPISEEHPDGIPVGVAVPLLSDSGRSPTTTAVARRPSSAGSDQAKMQPFLRVLSTQMKRVTALSSREYVDLLRRQVADLELAVSRGRRTVLDLQNRVAELEVANMAARREVLEAQRASGEAEVRLRELSNKKKGFFLGGRMRKENAIAQH